MALKKRIVVAGLGSIGRRHARLLSQREDLQVEWCESSAEAIALAQKELGRPVQVHASYEAMLETRPAMVVVATPHAMHATQAVAALNAGIHVLCEKPLSDTLENAHEIVTAAACSSATLSVGFQLHFHPALCRARSLIRSGELGSIHHLHCLVGTYVTLENSRSRYQSRIEGALFMDYAHQPDIFYWLLGLKPQGVYVAGGQGGSLPLQANPNYAAITCDYAEPVIASIHLNYLQVPDRHEYEIIGDQGWVSLDMIRGELRRGCHRDRSVCTESFSTDRDPLYEQEHQAFLDTVAGKRQPESSAADSLVSMEVISAALVSYQTRQRQACERAVDRRPPA